MKIAIFGGSFNPITKAHIQSAEYVIDKLKLDKLFFVPNFVSPFKKNNTSVIDSKHRVAMIEKCLPKKSEISLFEVKRKGPSYTADTVKYFKTKYPKAKIYVVIGTDQLVKLSKWKYIEKITPHAQFVVLRRQKTFSKTNIKKYGALLLDNKILDGSSTEVREGNFKFVTKEVNQYIGENHLYLNEIAKSMLDHTRYKHSLAVADWAVKLSKLVGYDAEKAYVAGMLHDITKTQTNEWHRKFIARYSKKQNISDFQLHSMSGYLWVKHIYMINNEEIAKAILRHTSLAKELSLLDKIIYAADKLCDGRKYNGIQKDRNLILKDFDKGFTNLVAMAWDFLKEVREIDKTQDKIYKMWSGK